MDIQSYRILPAAKRKLWQDFLCRMSLNADENTDCTILVFDEEQLIATGSSYKNVLKCIAVDPSRQGQGLLATVLTHLRQETFRNGHHHLFLYTKPENEHLFAPLFFYPVARTEQVLLMEDRPDGIRNFLNNIPILSGGTVGAVVMNCDPFTLGHRHLVKTAAAECDHVYLFVLSEDGGKFSPQERLNMVKAGTADLPNVTVLPTGPYLISAATFPTYFLKNRDLATSVQCQLDVEIFARHFAPFLGITRRYVGTEPLSPMTNAYNNTLSASLPGYNIELRQIPRLCLEDIPISASAVRAYIASGSWERIRPLVPATTFDYLQEVVK